MTVRTGDAAGLGRPDGTGARTVRGEAVTSDGWPVPDAMVTVVDADGVQVGHAPASSDGRFVLDLLPGGPATVITSAPGHSPVARSVAGGGARDLGRVVLARVGALTLPGAGTWAIDPVHSRISASAFHLGLTKVHGRLRRFTGTIVMGTSLADTTVRASIESGGVDTDDEARDQHLRAHDFLDVLRFPDIGFASTSVTAHTSDHWTMRGDLALKGVVNPVALDVVYHGTGPDPWGGERAGFSATTQLSRDDFDISWNQSVIAGIFAVGRTLRVEIDIEAVRAT